MRYSNENGNEENVKAFDAENNKKRSKNIHKIKVKINTEYKISQTVLLGSYNSNN